MKTFDVLLACYTELEVRKLRHPRYMTITLSYTTWNIQMMEKGEQIKKLKEQF